MYAQVWQWLHHKVKLDDGQVITRERFGRMLDEEMDKLRRCAAVVSPFFYNFRT